MIVTKNNKVPIALQYTRIVHGGRGDYMELAPDHLTKRDIFRVPDDQRWRVDDPYWSTLIYYEWWEVDGVKLYFQKRPVGYADYKVGYWYVDPDLVEEVDQ